MKKQLSSSNLMLLVLLTIFNFSFVNSQDFNFDITDANMTIQVPDEVSSSVVEIGDYLGVFFTNNDGDLQCAGYQTYVGDDLLTPAVDEGQLAIAAWASESGLFNGFAAGEDIQWAMYDASEGSTILLDSEMNSSPPFSTSFTILIKNFP